MKYMGSKARFAKHILPIVLEGRTKEQTYVEPFAGGMNVIDKVEGKRIANDIHTELIEMWKALVCDNWKPPHYTKEQYQQIRTNKKSYEPHVVGWVGFACSYSGKYFGGYAGDYFDKGKNYKLNGERNVQRNYQTEAINSTAKQIQKLKGVKFTNINYLELQIPPNSVIYCDPPYQNTTKYSHTFNHSFFWDWCREKSKQGHTVFVSEYAAPDDFECVWQKEAKSFLSANGKIGGNKVSVEKLFKFSPTNVQ